MIVTPENSMRLYREMASNPPAAPLVTMKPIHDSQYRRDGKDQVAIVRTEDEVSPGIITASNNMVASDAVSASLMQKYRTVRVMDFKTQDQIQFKLVEKLGLGVPNLSGIHLEHLNSVKDEGFEGLMSYIQSELR